MGWEELMKWKQQTSGACDEAAFEKSNRPFVEQFPRQYPDQDYCPETDSNQGRYDVKERENAECHGLFSLIHLAFTVHSDRHR